MDFTSFKQRQRGFSTRFDLGKIFMLIIERLKNGYLPMAGTKLERIFFERNNKQAIDLLNQISLFSGLQIDSRK